MGQTLKGRTVVDSHPTIQELIQHRRDETGWSLRAIAKATGDRVAHQTVSKLASGPPREWPKNVETITGLAAALNVPEDTIVLAFASAMGIPVRRQPSLLALQLPASADLLTAAERNHIIGLVQALTAGRTDPTDPTGDAAEVRRQNDRINAAGRAIRSKSGRGGGTECEAR